MWCLEALVNIVLVFLGIISFNQSKSPPAGSPLVCGLQRMYAFYLVVYMLIDWRSFDGVHLALRCFMCTSWFGFRHKEGRGTEATEKIRRLQL